MFTGDSWETLPERVKEICEPLLKTLRDLTNPQILRASNSVQSWPWANKRLR